MVPDQKLMEKESAEERKVLDAIRDKLSLKQTQEIIEGAKELIEFQKKTGRRRC